MTVYINKNKDSRSIFASVDFDDAHNTAFSIVKNEVDVEKAKKILADAGEKFVAQSYVKGQTIIITQGKLSKEEFFQKITSMDEDKFEPAPKKKKTSLEWVKDKGWQLRGGSSIVGQSMTLFSTTRTPHYKKDAGGNSILQRKDGKIQTKFDPATGAFAALNLAANFINLIFGGQKEEDVKGLAKFDAIIADEVNRYIPDGAKKLSPDDVSKLSYMTDEEEKEHNKDRSAAGVLKRNSVKLGEVGLRTLGSIFLVFNYKSLVNIGKGGLSLNKTSLQKMGEHFKSGEVKELWNTVKTADDYTRTAGYGMVAGKAMGLLAETYDPKDPPKTYWQELKQKVLWRVSSFTEMVAQGSLVYDRAKNKKIAWGNELKSDYVGAVGNVALTVPPYPARLVLPYGQKILDKDEVQARLLDELPKLPKDKITEVAARVTARMVEYLGDDSPDFSVLYKQLLNKLDHYHDIYPLPHRVENSAPEVQTVTKEGIAANEPAIAREDAKFVEKLEAEKNKVDPAREQARDRIKEIIKDGVAANHENMVAADNNVALAR